MEPSAARQGGLAVAWLDGPRLVVEYLYCNGRMEALRHCEWPTSEEEPVAVVEHCCGVKQNQFSAVGSGGVSHTSCTTACWGSSSTRGPLPSKCLEALLGLLSLLHGHCLQVRTLEQDMRRITAQLAAGGLPDMEAWTPVGLLLMVGRLRTERIVIGQLDSWWALWKRCGEPPAMSLHEVDDLVLRVAVSFIHS